MTDSNKKITVCHFTSVHQATDTRIFFRECHTLINSGFETHIVAPNTQDQIVDGVFIHGIMHLCGYDHERSEKEAEETEKKQEKYLSD
mgnify:CR=1 FL=1